MVSFSMRRSRAARVDRLNTSRITLVGPPRTHFTPLPHVGHLVVVFASHVILSGVRVVAGAVGDLPSVLDSEKLGAALGGLEDVASSDRGEDEDESTSSDGTAVCLL